MNAAILALLLASPAHALTLVNEVPEHDALAVSFQVNQDGLNLRNVIVVTNEQKQVPTPPMYVARLRARLHGELVTTDDAHFAGGAVLVPTLIDVPDFFRFDLAVLPSVPGHALLHNGQDFPVELTVSPGRGIEEHHIVSAQSDLPLELPPAVSTYVVRAEVNKQLTMEVTTSDPYAVIVLSRDANTGEYKLSL